MKGYDGTMSGKGAPKKCYIIPHTHWDREWRWPIWKTRKLLADFMKQLLDILDNDTDYHYFLMDGQVAPVVDYLEIYPEDRERITRHIKSGRIGVGPWYTLPDLYPVDGECLIRNLNKGLAVCNEFGTPTSIGYNSFGWGQTAQLPQIYADYGFETIICAKKVSEARAPYAEFMWESPDGTRVLTSRLGEYARANFFFNAYIDVRYGLRFLSEEFAYSPGKSGSALHRADRALRDDDWFLTEPKAGHDWDRLADGLAASFDAAANTLAPETLLLLSGCDFSTPQPDLSEIIGRASEQFPEIEFLNASVEDYARDLRESLLPGGESLNAPIEAYARDLREKMPSKSDAPPASDTPRALPVVYGELRDGPSCDCSGNALSVRCYLKQLNKKAQSLLLGSAEPFCTFAEAAGLMDYPAGFIGKAWDYLLNSHSHDAINGVTRDKTADDVEHRLKQAVELSETAMEMAVEAITKALSFSARGADGTGGAAAAHIVVFNSTPHAARDILRLSVDTPESERAWDVTLKAIDGTCDRTEIAQPAGREKISAPVHDLDGRPWPFYADRHDLWADTGEIPAMGYRVFRVERTETYKPKHHYWLPMRKTYLPDISTETGVLENEFLRVRMNPDGTFDLTDKESGAVCAGMNRFEDTGDAGNYWAYYPPTENRTYTSLGAAPRMWTEANGPLIGTITVAHEMSIPAYGHTPAYGFGKSARSEGETTLNIETRVSLKLGARRVEIETTVENNALNHRLRVAMPTGIRAKCASASGHFTTDMRPVCPVREADGGFWPEMQTLPMQSFVDVSDGRRAVALLSGDIFEYEAAPDPGGTVWLTLFRAVENMIVTGWECVNRFPDEDGSQLQRAMTFSYAVFPHAGEAGGGRVYAEADAFLNKPAAWQTCGGGERGSDSGHGSSGDNDNGYGSKINRGSDALPAARSFLSIEDNDLILSAFKKADDGDGYVLRIYNPTEREVRTDIAFAWPVKDAREASMREKVKDPAGHTAQDSAGHTERAPIDHTAHKLHVRAPKGKILTYRLWFD
jgi:mannosylglycerate hydrolase